MNIKFFKDILSLILVRKYKLFVGSIVSVLLLCSFAAAMEIENSADITHDLLNDVEIRFLRGSLLDVSQEVKRVVKKECDKVRLNVVNAFKDSANPQRDSTILTTSYLDMSKSIDDAIKNLNFDQGNFNITVLTGLKKYYNTFCDDKQQGKCLSLLLPIDRQFFYRCVEAIGKGKKKKSLYLLALNITFSFLNTLFRDNQGFKDGYKCAYLDNQRSWVRSPEINWKWGKDPISILFRGFNSYNGGSLKEKSLDQACICLNTTLGLGKFSRFKNGTISKCLNGSLMLSSGLVLSCMVVNFIDKIVEGDDISSLDIAKASAALVALGPALWYVPKKVVKELNALPLRDWARSFVKLTPLALCVGIYFLKSNHGEKGSYDG